MRLLIVFLGLLFAAPAFAMSDSIIDYCLTTNNPKDCLSSFLAEEREFQLRLQRESQQRQLDAQLEQARIQANGMMLFGSGPALIQGMNQGLQNMQLPYVSAPYISDQRRR